MHTLLWIYVGWCCSQRRLWKCWGFFLPSPCLFDLYIISKKVVVCVDHVYNICWKYITSVGSIPKSEIISISNSCIMSYFYHWSPLLRGVVSSSGYLRNTFWGSIWYLIWYLEQVMEASLNSLKSQQINSKFYRSLH